MTENEEKKTDGSERRIRWKKNKTRWTKKKTGLGVEKNEGEREEEVAKEGKMSGRQ